MENRTFINLNLNYRKNNYKTMLDLVIKVENRFVGDAVNLLFDNYKEQFAVFLNNVLKNETGSADAFITKDEQGVINVYQTAPDKGNVLGQVDGVVVLTQYSTLPVDAKYVVFDGQHLTLFLKQDEGVSDIKIGRFANINEVVTQIDAENVQITIDTVKSAINNAAVERKKLEKKARKAARGLKVVKDEA